MRPGINFMIGLIIGFLLAACITDSFSCETAQCRADRGHNAEGAMITSLLSAAVEPYNQQHHPESAKIRTFAEVLLASAAISIATEWFFGRHGRGFNNHDAWERFGGGFAGATMYQGVTFVGRRASPTYQIDIFEHKF